MKKLVLFLKKNKILTYGDLMVDNFKVSGVMVHYYILCKRKLWFYIHNINMAYDNDDITIGKDIHKNSFKRKNKEIQIDNMVFDFIEDKNKLTIFEVKKSSKLLKSSKYQLYYYLYSLKKVGLDSKGVLVFPKEKKRESIYLSSDIEEELNEIISNISKIAEQEKPPKEINTSYCRKCSFFELCKI